MPVVFCSSASHNNSGKIMSVSRNCSSKLGKDLSSIPNLNISSLVGGKLKQQHEDVVIDFLKDSQKYNNYIDESKTRLLFLPGQEEYPRRCYVKTKIVMFSDVCFVTSVEPIKGCVVCIDAETACITGMTKQSLKILQSTCIGTSVEGVFKNLDFKNLVAQIL